MQPFIWNLISFIVALGLLVFIHEFGHFWVARKNNVKVLKFSVGFGRSIYSWRDKYDTEFSIGIIPLGGYVRMLDDRIDDVAPEDIEYSFNKKRVGQRIAVVSAGPAANFLFAIVALFLTLVIGVPTVKPVIGQVEKNSIASSQDIRPLDVITKVNDEPVADWQQAQHHLVKAIGNDALLLQLERQGSLYSVTLPISSWSPENGELLEGLGISVYRPQPTLVIGQVVADSAAYKGGLLVGDKVLSVNNDDITEWQQFVSVIANNPGQDLSVLVSRDSSTHSLKLTADTRFTDQGFSQGYLGVAPVMNTWPKDYVFDHQYGIFPALLKAVEKTWDLTTLIFSTVAKLVVGDISINNLSGPISIAQGAGVSAQGGLVYFLGFLALISVNLGVVNLLPLPALDGGHLMYFFIELIRGKPVSERVQEIGFRIGAFLLMMIMGVAIINDFGRL